MYSMITLQVNGQSRSVRVDPETPLIYVLRNDLGLKGTKFGCGMEQCGACKVIVDGQAVPSCKRSVSSVIGCEITTVEGVGSAERLHPVQKAFIAAQAAQCGFCTSGLIVAAKALLDRTVTPSDDEICDHLAIHLCRCGSHNRILRAVKQAAREMAS
ncbi:MAG: (2Fe-2S)-binding protein [bacterium]|nr:(2Fe-2S)-binding protein [bacterium]